MGGKAKEKIQAAENAITNMNTAADDLQQDFQKLVLQETTHEALLKDIVGRCAKVHPGVQDISTLMPADQELTRMVTTMNGSQKKLDDIKVGLKARVILLDQRLATAREANTGLENLIATKQAKLNAAGKNPVKVVLAKAKTKSLPDLRAEKLKIDEAIRGIVDRTLATKKYVEKVL